MSAWSKKVREALKTERVRQGIGQIAVSWLTEHIEQNRGRGRGGGVVAHAPLKPVFGQRWVTSKPRGGAGVVRTRTVMKLVNGRMRRQTQYLVQAEGYRTTSGGQPLRDTGEMLRSMSGEAKVRGDKLTIVLSGVNYALYQDRGFRTKGPNYIPLTKRGKRGHATGANPSAEGLTRGKDFTMAWKGVTVPSRPFLLPLRSDLRTLGKSIYMGLKAVLKGK